MIRFFFLITSFLFILHFSNSVLADENDIKVDKISKNLRCLICQGQSVYDSQSDFAISVRDLIRKKIEVGNSDEDIYEYLKDKYGDWIMYEPELDKKTLLLWILPLILFVFGGLLIFKKASIN
ncbi:MAG: cytochrome c-type biogenesis protein CcmH [Candidatus Pelagibacter sp. TMED118]|nr:MAG: cytochrome c-type biogenesis protein CcmH [Candidatus Pelagibacter sp. TMED118]|tara:strand:+ start:2610 stop:2978 length:369 start_codon:yes stop_codon:yes gene_type:complete